MSDNYTNEEKVKHLFEIIKRTDAYILSTNQKCAIIISYCVAVVGWLSINITRILSDFSPATLYCIAVVAIFVLISFSCLCICLAVAVIFPITNSSVERVSDESMIFFGDVAVTKHGAGGYLKKINELDLPAFVNDLGQQVFTLSTIADSKFKKIKALNRFLVGGTIVPLFVLLVSLLVNSVLIWVAK
ncbi:hypothetical protein I5S60_14545 [Pseudomonas fluorescens]|nr:hypothetical protein [Pseudomonas fluorescens]